MQFDWTLSLLKRPFKVNSLTNRKPMQKHFFLIVVIWLIRKRIAIVNELIRAFIKISAVLFDMFSYNIILWFLPIQVKKMVKRKTTKRTGRAY